MSEITVSPIVGAVSPEQLRAFFGRVPGRDRTFFREHVLEPGVVEGWYTEPPGRRFAALAAGEIVGYLAVLPGVGWSSHVGEIRLVVDPEQRRRGIGRFLARTAVVEAAGQGLTKVLVEVVAEQTETVAMFSALGFEAEGLLRDQVRGPDGEVHDLLLLAHLLDDLWSTMQAVGAPDAVGG
jgi:ribosomal protein S18 acetylase RimI-like enzyme